MTARNDRNTTHSAGYARRVSLVAFALFTALTLATTPGIAHAKTYHVFHGAPAASDENPGSQEKPFLTLVKAAGIATAGDTVIVQGGPYYEGVVVISSGTPASPLVFQGQGRPLVENSGGKAFTILGDHVRIEGFELANSMFGAEVSGTGVVLQDCAIHNNFHEGIRLKKSTNTTIRNCSIDDNGPGNSIGLWLEGPVRALLVEDTRFTSTGLQTTAINAFEAGASDGLVFRRILVRDHPGYGALLMAEAPGDLTGVRVEASRFEGNGGGIVNILGDFTYRQGNLLLQRTHGAVILNNVFIAGSGWGVDCYTSNNVVFANNLFLDNFDRNTPAVGPGIGLEVNAGRDVLVVHNLFVGNTLGVQSSYLDSGGPWPPGFASLLLQNNLFYGNTKAYDEVFKDGGDVAVTKRANHLEADPLFIAPDKGDYHLRPGSPAVDAGEALVDSAAPGLDADFDGNPRPRGKAPDIGPFESPSKE